MLLLFISAVGLYYSWYRFSTSSAAKIERVTGGETDHYKNPYFPEEGGTFDKIQSRISGQWPGVKYGKQEYNHRLPFITTKDNNDKLQETMFGWSPLPRGTNLTGQINAVFNETTHPLFDPLFVQAGRCQKRRAENSFYFSD